MDISIPKNFAPKVVPETEARAMMSEEMGYFIEKWNLKEIWKQTKGDMVKIAVLDTGAPTHHDSLVHEMHNFTSDKGEVDANGHGSHVTGIINAQHNGFAIRGIAPNAQIISCKVLNKDGAGSSSWIEDALQMIHDRDDIDIVNMSLGSSSLKDSVREILVKLHQKGVSVFVAAGNWGANMSNAYAIPETFAVAAADKFDKPASFSSNNTENDGTGYGVNIRSFGVGNAFWDASGTSMACPSVAGVAALIISQWKKSNRNKKFPPKELFRLLRETAKDIAAPGFDDKTGFGLIQPIVAFDVIRDLPPEGPIKDIPIDKPKETEPPVDSKKNSWLIGLIISIVIFVILAALMSSLQS